MIHGKTPVSFQWVRYFSLLKRIAAFSLIGIFSLSMHATGDEIDGWKKAESDDQYPPLYSDDFIDSLLDFKDAYVAKNWRSLPPPPFCIGEKLVYTMGWGPLHAGYAILTTEPDTINQTIVMTGKLATNAFFSTFYKVRDHYRTIIDKEGIYPLFFDQHIHEGKFKTRRWELYDHARRLVLTDKNKPEFFKNKPFGQSLMSCVYFLRTLTFAPGDSFKIDCFVDTMCHTVVMKCIERKNITVDVGTFDCLLVKPYLVGKGRVFSKKDEIKVWFTNDEYKMPIVIESKIRWGSIFARLVWYSRKIQ